MQIPSDALQIVVHDTSNDACELAHWVARQSDSRLTYVHVTERLSMTDNHERAIELASGEYVCLIGDDDSVSAHCVALAEMARQKGMDLVTPKVSVAYYWPDFRSRFYGAAHAGRLYLDAFTGEIREFDLQESLLQALAAACQGTDLMPKLYHGLVRRSVLDELRREAGRLFFGTSPDMSVAVGLALRGGKYHVIDLPLTLPGSAGGSNSGRSAMRQHKGALEKDPHLEPFRQLEWPEVIPRFFSVETVWAHAAWMTLQLPGRRSFLERFNLARLYALCMLHHREYLAATLEARRCASTQGIARTGMLDTVGELACEGFRHALQRGRRLMNPSPSGGREVLAVAEDVARARDALDARLSSSPFASQTLSGDRAVRAGS